MVIIMTCSKTLIHHSSNQAIEICHNRLCFANHLTKAKEVTDLTGRWPLQAFPRAWRIPASPAGCE